MLITGIICFAIVSLSNVYTSKATVGKWAQILNFISKALLMPSLAFIYLASGVTRSPLLLAALAAGWIGDIVLELPASKRSPINATLILSAGMLAFLTGHILYTILFLRGSLPLSGELSLLLPLFLLYLFYGLIVIPRYEIKGFMAGAVSIYLVAESLMSFACLLQLIRLPGVPALLIFLGSLLFIASDTVLANYKFHPLPNRDYRFVMSSYIGAQLMIVTGYILLVK